MWESNLQIPNSWSWIKTIHDQPFSPLLSPSKNIQSHLHLVWLKQEHFLHCSYLHFYIHLPYTFISVMRPFRRTFPRIHWKETDGNPWTIHSFISIFSQLSTYILVKGSLHFSHISTNMNYYNKFLSRPKSVLPPYTSRQYTVDRPDTNAVLNPEHNPVDCQSVTTDRQPNTLPLLGYRERIMVARHKTIIYSDHTTPYLVRRTTVSDNWLKTDRDLDLAQ